MYWVGMEVPLAAAGRTSHTTMQVLLLLLARRPSGSAASAVVPSSVPVYRPSSSTSQVRVLKSHRRAVLYSQPIRLAACRRPTPPDRGPAPCALSVPSCPAMRLLSGRLASACTGWQCPRNVPERVGRRHGQLVVCVAVPANLIATAHASASSNPTPSSLHAARRSLASTTSAMNPLPRTSLADRMPHSQLNTVARCTGTGAGASPPTATPRRSQPYRYSESESVLIPISKAGGHPAATFCAQLNLCYAPFRHVPQLHAVVIFPPRPDGAVGAVACRRRLRRPGHECAGPVLEVLNWQPGKGCLSTCQTANAVGAQNCRIARPMLRCTHPLPVHCNPSIPQSSYRHRYR